MSQYLDLENLFAGLSAEQAAQLSQRIAGAIQAEAQAFRRHEPPIITWLEASKHAEPRTSTYDQRRNDQSTM